MMKSEFQRKLSPKFPCMATTEDGLVVIMYTADTKGLVIHDPDNRFGGIGCFKTNLPALSSLNRLSAGESITLTQE